jgi:hypothetical protein
VNQVHAAQSDLPIRTIPDRCATRDAAAGQ